jgi:hypothetical protein
MQRRWLQGTFTLVGATLPFPASPACLPCFPPAEPRPSQEEAGCEGCEVVRGMPPPRPNSARPRPAAPMAPEPAALSPAPADPSASPGPSHQSAQPSPASTQLSCQPCSPGPSAGIKTPSPGESVTPVGLPRTWLTGAAARLAAGASQLPGAPCAHLAPLCTLGTASVALQACQVGGRCCLTVWTLQMSTASWPPLAQQGGRAGAKALRAQGAKHAAGASRGVAEWGPPCSPAPHR